MFYLISKSKISKIVSTVLILSTLIIPSHISAVTPINFPNVDPVSPVPTADNALRAKESGITVLGINTGVTIDGLAIIVLRRIINALGDATVRWINDAFDDSPAGGGQAFAVDLEKVLKDTGSAIAGNVIENVAPALCSPFSNQIKIALIAINARQNNSDNFNGGRCPFSTVAGNFENFLSGDFIDNGGWNSWYVMTQNPLGNPYSSFLNVQADINTKVADETAIRKQQLDWGRGFFGTADCVEGKMIEGKCAQYKPVKTPGTVIENQLGKVLNVEVDQLNIADEFDEIITALAKQLTNKVFSKSDGLFSRDNRSYSGNSNNPTAPNFGICYPSKENAIVGEEITWSFTGAGDPSTTYTWSGDEGLTSNTNSATVSYTTAGKKNAVVSVVNKIQSGVDANNVPIFITQPAVRISCRPSVTVSRFGPLAISCILNSRENMFIPPNDTRTWTIKITGGSGQLSYINLDEYKTLGRPTSGPITVGPDSFSPNPFVMGGMAPYRNIDFDTAFISTPPGVASPTVPFNPSQPDTTGGIILTGNVMYRSPGIKEFAFQEIVDLDPSVPILRDASCSSSGFEVFQRR